ncbi:AraC family transcriptional regulator [Pseudomonas sp. BN515]|uniref:AraC-like transcriptional regulator QhpR n=1 Tax=Pseudomonas sp. BN515 TaxID=2567892 RepID=UPI0024570124|nr:AraC family transcriptional regulator [Pseudomonas sp. BN515]MDH4873589.1 AraC family transcriptional regulator [Pseudomonas sp. BN515]
MSRLKHTVYTEALLQHYGDLFRPHLAAVGLSEEVLERPDAKIPLSQYIALLEVTAERVDSFLGLRLGLGLLGESFKSSLFGGVGHLVRSAADVRTMLECGSRYLVVHAQANELAWRLQGGCLEISYRMTDPSVLHRRQDAEFAVGTLYARLREYTGGKYAPLRVEFEHPQPADTSLHNEVFRCPVKFGQPTNVMVWPGEMLDEPLITADLRLFQALLPGLEEERRRRLADTDLTTRIGMVIEANLASGRVGLEQVATELHMSKRTLQRRLQELDLEFAELVEEIRQALAIELVRQSPRSLTEIAQQLGYNEASSFTRAFRRWTGLSPREFRQQGTK